MNRRKFVVVGLLGGAGLVAGKVLGLPSLGVVGAMSDTELRKRRLLVQTIKPAAFWTSTDLLEYLGGLKIIERRSLALCLSESYKLEDWDVSPPHLVGEFRKRSSNFIKRPFLSKDRYNYHEVVQWVARRMGVTESIVDTEPTFKLESWITLMLFSNIWDNLTRAQRMQLLIAIDKDSRIANKAAIAAASGSAALAMLSTTVYFSGFAFYTTLSIIISSLAGILGLTLPFAAYMTASSTVALLGGPVGVGIAAVLLASTLGYAFFKDGDVQRASAFVIQTHLLKVQQIMGSGMEEDFQRFLIYRIQR